MGVGITRALQLRLGIVHSIGERVRVLEWLFETLKIVLGLKYNDKTDFFFKWPIWHRDRRPEYGIDHRHSLRLNPPLLDRGIRQFADGRNVKVFSGLSGSRREVEGRQGAIRRREVQSRSQDLQTSCNV